MPTAAIPMNIRSVRIPAHQLIHDWEVQEAYRQYKRRYGNAALEHLQRMYGETIPARNLHLIMGTMLAHPRTYHPSSSSACCAQASTLKNSLSRGSLSSALHCNELLITSVERHSRLIRYCNSHSLL